MGFRVLGPRVFVSFVRDKRGGPYYRALPLKIVRGAGVRVRSWGCSGARAGSGKLFDAFHFASRCCCLKRLVQGLGFRAFGSHINTALDEIDISLRRKQTQRQRTTLIPGAEGRSLDMHQKHTWRFMGSYTISGVISRIIIIMTHIWGTFDPLITTHETSKQVKPLLKEGKYQKL